MTTHNGKIGRLPKQVRDELNQRLDNGEPGDRILEWLNGLPQIKHVLARDFGGGGINAQNLSNWRKGGHQEWLKQQERRNLVRELTENAEELAAEAGGVEIGNHFSAMLVADFAASALATLATITDPAERCVREQEFLQTLVRVRRQDYLAGQLAIERERRARERIEEKRKDDWRDEFQKDNATFIHFMNQSMMDNSFACPDILSQAMASDKAESLLRGVKLEPQCPARSSALDNPESN